MKTENNLPEENEAFYTCNGCGADLTEEQIAYQNDDTGDDYCSECYEAIQDDQETF